MGQCDVVMHLAYGLRIDSDLALPGSTGPADSVRLPADLHVRRGRVDTSTVRLVPTEDDGTVWVDQGWDGDRVVLIFPGVAAELRAGSDELTVDVAPGDDAGDDAGDDDWAAHVVVDHVVPRWLALQGDLVLHAGSVTESSGRAVAFIGDTGAGKSSTATALALAGRSMLGDDACRLVRGDADWLAVPSYPGVRLTGASRAALVPGLRSVPMAAGADKHRVLPHMPRAESPAPLGLVVELGDDRPRPSLRRLSLSEATAALVRHSFHLAPSADRVAPQAFELCSALASRVPCVRVDFRREWDVFDELADLLGSVEAGVS